MMLYASVDWPSFHCKLGSTSRAPQHRRCSATCQSARRCWSGTQLLTFCFGLPDRSLPTSKDVNYSLRAAVEDDQLSASNGSFANTGEHSAETVKSNGSSVAPVLEHGDDGGPGQGGGGGPGDGPDRSGHGSPGDGPDNQTKALLLLLSTLLGAASLYGIYHLVQALQGLIPKRQAAQATTTHQQR